MNILHQLKTNIFATTIKLLNNNNIPFWLDDKTLLSIMGEKNKLSLLYDKNVRISIPGEHFSKLMTLEKGIGFAYRFQLVPNSSGRNWTENIMIH